MSDIQLSYSLVETWKRGDKQKAIDTYLHLDNFQNDAMRGGSDFDKYVEEFVDKNKRLPPELGGMELNHPICKLKCVEEYKPGIRLSGEFDIWSIPDIIEIKRSVAADSAEWIERNQINWYFLLMDLWTQHHTHDESFTGAKRAILYRFDPIHKKYDRSIAYYSQRRIEAAKADIDKYGPEIKSFFEEEGVI